MPLRRGFSRNPSGRQVLRSPLSTTTTLFRNQIDFAILDFTTFTGQYENIDKSIAHGAEIELHGRPLSPRLSIDARLQLHLHANSRTAIRLRHSPSAGPAAVAASETFGEPAADLFGKRWGANLGGSFVGRRADSDFLGFNIDHAAGYARVDLGGWYAVTSRITGYVNVENAFDKHYQEVVGYPALGVNFRAGVRFRIGGE